MTDEEFHSLSDREVRKEMDSGRYFMDYQVETIMDEHRLNIVEKSIRIGITFAYAMRGVRRRMHALGNLLHTSVTAGISRQFITDCDRFNRIYDVTFASDPSEREIWNPDEDRAEKSYRIDYKPPGKEDVFIEAFGSVEDNMRGKGGEVDIDEITSHKRAKEMQKAAGGRAMWGYPVNVWSSHKGINSHFNQLIRTERAKGAESRWNIRTITLMDALDQGLLEKINQISGANMTREDFIADTIAAVGGQDAFDEECMCNPKAEGSQAIKWGFLDAAKQLTYLKRKHLEGDESFDAAGWLADLVPLLRAADRTAVGYDVARTGHLSAVPIAAKYGNTWKLMGLLTMHKRKFGLQRDAVAACMLADAKMLGGGDATGLGMQVCEELTDQFGEHRFSGLNFGTTKPAIGTKLIRMFEDGAVHLSQADADEDIIYDLAALYSVTMPGGRVRFAEGPNPINKLSHCDIAWGIGLALFVGEEDSTVQGMW